MKLGTKGRYAVMAMVDLAGQLTAQPDLGPVTLSGIAARQEISLSYLEQLFSKLRKAGIVKSVRGPGGGYVLARAADKVRISDIVLAVDEPIRTTRCSPDSGRGCSPDGSRCLTHELWEELGNQIYQYLKGVPLEDVCARRITGSREPLASAVSIARAEERRSDLRP